ncbi:3537_t:CDS:10 [Diversispora eburnea]|uniref:3537_t:CDS:1 n=1 Tax=Diversispora eburnea TaxID=1213867 RepID=A0A9N9ATJ7_9GLOM|nr:3537_t:CDS:10 [Diversispora eburnea]
MNSWESLYHAATNDYNTGNFKESYINYCKAANALLFKLSNEVAFVRKDAVKSKPTNSARLFHQLKSCVASLEDILHNQLTNGHFPSPQPSYISDVATSIFTNSNPQPLHLPLVPFSPLTRQAIHYAHELATASQKVSAATQKSNNTKDLSPSVIKLTEEVRAQRTKLDQVNNHIQSVAENTLLYWEAIKVAQQLTIIESQLYSKVDFRKDLTSKDKKNNRAQACMDFHRYLTNSFTHQLIIYADNSANSSRNPRENIIAFAIKIAFYLFNVHRNFNSFAAVIKALTSPEVYRIKRLWNNVSSRQNQILKELSVYIKKEDNEYKAYKEIVSQKVEEFRDASKGMIIIPWMQPHYEEIKKITQSYTSGKSGDSSNVILSAPGARKLDSIFSFLEQCQKNQMPRDDDEISTSRKTASTSRVREQITLDGNTIPLPLDLSCQGFGDLGIHHWLVSRVYLTKQQLIDESIEIEPLGENEQLPCDVGSDDGGDNIETTTNVSTKNIIVTEFNVQSKLSENSGMDKITASPKGPINIKSGQIESSPKTRINEISTLHASLMEETSKSVEMFEENTTQIDFSKSDSTPRSAAIAIPQSSKSNQPISSPQSNSVKNLNPNAPAFVPRSQSFSTPSILVLSGGGDGIKESSTKEFGEIENINKSEEDEDESEFIYEGASTSNDQKGNEEEESVFHYEKDDTSEFKYYPSKSPNLSNSSTPSNSDNIGKPTDNGGIPAITVKINGGAINKNTYLAFLDISPLSEGHTLVIPKYHSKFLHELPDEYLADLLPVAKKVAIATGAEQYNILQNNGPLAHQVVEHVHIHVEKGLGIRWDSQQTSKEELKATADRITKRVKI